MGYRDSHGKALTDYPRPSVAVDTAVLTVPPEGALSVVLVPAATGHDGGHADSGAHPSDTLRLPGTFLHEGERLADAVARSLEEKAGIRGVTPKQLHVFDEPSRDDRGWVLSVAHLVAVPSTSLETLSPGATVVSVADAIGRPLGFDHAEIVTRAVQALRSEYRTSADPFRLLDEPFTLRELQRLHEAVAGEPLPRDTFRRRMVDDLVPTGSLSSGSVGKPARWFVHGVR